ncbi:MAG TPA: VCBS repeat-containing protein [Polyangiales bacterium]|nr:VCBS repeat-containing protein [Polyangiales bacterium]
MNHRRFLSAILALWLAACGRDVVTGRRCQPGLHCASGDDGANGNAGTGRGSGPGLGNGGALGTENALAVHVEDVRKMTIEVVTLSCSGECVDLEAVARGGNPPYTFAWEDGSTSAQRHLCVDASATLSVRATDTKIDDDEFSYPAQTVTAQVTAQVLSGCGGTGGPCGKRAEPGSFDPVVKWSWEGGSSLVTPLVANLTDDNGDGAVDLRDTPDIVLAADGNLIILDGATGKEHFRIAGCGGPMGNGAITPVLGDVDGDRSIDIIAVSSDGKLAAFRHDGTPLWTGDAVAATSGAASLSLADLDHDGSPEIIATEAVYDAHGALKWKVGAGIVGMLTTPTAADLDDDGFMEVIWGPVAYRHDGTVYYDNADIPRTGPYAFSLPAVADLDGDGKPEVIITVQTSVFVLDYAGKTVRSATVGTSSPTTLFGIPIGGGFAFPPAIHDLDGDGKPEIMVSDGGHYHALAGDLTEHWSLPVTDISGCAAGTAFDFLGDGTAEAMYGDEHTSWGFDGADGHVIFMQPRTSGTLIEYPTVADVDADGSADILIVSDKLSANPSGVPATPTLQVISDRMGRWIPARRIMNQDTYHVTNIDDDGTVPVHEMPSWKLNNSFRAQAQVNGGGVCIPRVE